MFSGSPVKRIGRDRFLRNVLIAAGNSADASLAGECLDRIADHCALVRGAAVWALSRLLDGPTFHELAARHAGSEVDDEVRAEWAQATTPLGAGT